MIWIFHRSDTGRVTKVMEADEANAILNLADGEELMETDQAGVSPDTHYVRDGVIKAYPERPGPHHTFDFATAAWIDPRTPEQVAADELAAYRATIPKEVSVMQAMIVVGEPTWSDAMALADNPTYPWAMRAAIRGATSLIRDSETMDTIAFLLGLSPDEVDALFIAAAQVRL